MRRAIPVCQDEICDLQPYYHLLLESMAQPGKISVLPCTDLMPPAGLQKASALIALTLLNADVTFSYIGVNPGEVSNYILRHTASLHRAPEKADFIFMNGLRSGYEVAGISSGAPAYPEEGATVVVDVRSIRASAHQGYVRLLLCDSGDEVYVAGLNRGLLESLSVRNGEFPLILADGDSNICCISGADNRFIWKV
jgi:alpha-D-ribose 1-methylphosphonate 5-triphosphate synthase subunit PhnH